MIFKIKKLPRWLAICRLYSTGLVWMTQMNQRAILIHCARYFRYMDYCRMTDESCVTWHAALLFVVLHVKVAVYSLQLFVWNCSLESCTEMGMTGTLHVMCIFLHANKHTYQNGCVHDWMLYAAKKVEYNFTKRLPETATAKQKSELILECSLSEDKPSVVWRNNGVVIEVRTQYCSFFSAFSLQSITIDACTDLTVTVNTLRSNSK